MITFSELGILVIHMQVQVKSELGTIVPVVVSAPICVDNYPLVMGNFVDVNECALNCHPYLILILIISYI